MLARKLAILIAAAAVSAPALAERGHRDHRPVQHHSVKHHPVAQQRTVVRHYYRPAPVVYHQVARPHTGAAIVFGAVLGAAIAHHVFAVY